ncbi:MAG: phage major capsid protein, partial [Clostridia bacterium]|nr:phage major capsid protein [Clostridia bacterium]
GDGSGVITYTTDDVTGNALYVDSVKGLMEGMTIDVYTPDETKNVEISGARIETIDRMNKTIYINKVANSTCEGGSLICVQGSKGNELTGLEAIFGTGDLYGLSRTNYPWLNPYVNNESVSMDDVPLQTTIDAIEDKAGSEVDFIACSRSARKAYQQYLTYFRRNVDVTELAGGFKAITFNGIPVVADRFIKDGTAYFLNTKDFTLHQLCDWQWLEGEDGKIIKQNPGFPSYNATLVKYADLVCDRPLGQAKLSNISNTITNPYAEINS